VISWKEFLCGLVLVIAHLLITAAVHAQDATAPLPDPVVPPLHLGGFQPLHRGQAAPADVLTVDPDTIIQIRLDYEALAARLVLDVQRERDRCALRLDMEQERTRAATERVTLHDELWTERQRELVAAVEQARRQAERQWWENPALWAALGAVIASAVAILVSQL